MILTKNPFCCCHFKRTKKNSNHVQRNGKLWMETTQIVQQSHLKRNLLKVRNLPNNLGDQEQPLVVSPAFSQAPFPFSMLEDFRAVIEPRVSREAWMSQGGVDYIRGLMASTLKEQLSYLWQTSSCICCSGCGQRKKRKFKNNTCHQLRTRVLKRYPEREDVANAFQ